MAVDRGVADRPTQSSSQSSSQSSLAGSAKRPARTGLARAVGPAAQLRATRSKNSARGGPQESATPTLSMTTSRDRPQTRPRGTSPTATPSPSPSPSPNPSPTRSKTTTTTTTTRTRRETKALGSTLQTSSQTSSQGTATRSARMRRVGHTAREATRRTRPALEATRTATQGPWTTSTKRERGDGVKCECDGVSLTAFRKDCERRETQGLLRSTSTHTRSRRFLLLRLLHQYRRPRAPPARPEGGTERGADGLGEAMVPRLLLSILGAAGALLAPVRSR